MSFRPLARLIGNYRIHMSLNSVQLAGRFPAPREVDRYLYLDIFDEMASIDEFPAPREVDRELYSS